MSKRVRKKAEIELTLMLPNGGRLEPVDILLIETIRQCRSISGAGRILDISYRKTWRMVDALNRTFSATVVETFPGRRDGGAEVTAFGERVVALYRSVERRTYGAADKALMELSSSIDPRYVPEAQGNVRSA